MAVITLTKQNFAQEVLNSDVPVLVDFWATWCGPCRMMGPVVEDIAETETGIKVGKLDVDQEGELAIQYGISSIPALLVFKNGKVAAQSVGARPKGAVLAMLNQVK